VDPRRVKGTLFLAVVVSLCGFFVLGQTACYAGTKIENQSDISELYMKNCARCHGKDGKGKEGRKDAPGIPDLTSHKWHGQRSDAQLTVSILDGKGKDMPSFGDKVTQEQAKALVKYVRQFDEEKSKDSSKEQSQSRSGSRQTSANISAEVWRFPLRGCVYDSVILLGTLLYPIKEQHPCSPSSDTGPPTVGAHRFPLPWQSARTWSSWKTAAC
jgi:cytochrome c553